MANLIKAVVNFTDGEITISALSGLGANKILVKIIDPLGNIVYKNTYYDESEDTDFDLQYSTSKTITKDMPLDSSNEIIQGLYYIYYKIAGYKGDTALWFKYCPTIPEIDISLEYSCRTSTITSTDNTNYDLVNSCSSGSVTVEASVTPYSHTLYYPTTMEEQEDPVTSVTPAVAIVVTPIWTKRWVAQIGTNVSYDMPLPTTIDGLAYFIEGTLNGQKYVDVACADCICSLLTCIDQVYNAYKLAVEKDSVRARELQTQLDMLYLLFFKFIFAERCGQESDTTSICNEIVAYLNFTGLACCSEDETSEYSQEVVSYGSISPSTSTVLGGTVWYSGSENPTAGVGLNGDFYLQTTSKTIWKKILGVWTDIMTVTFTGTVGNQIVEYDYESEGIILDDWTVIKEYTFGTDILSDGNAMVLTANLGITEPTNEYSGVRITFSTALISSSITIPINADYNGNEYSIMLKMEFLIEESEDGFSLIDISYYLISNTGIIGYGTTYDRSNRMDLDETSNTISLSLRSDGTHTLYVDNWRINLEKTV